MRKIINRICINELCGNCLYNEWQISKWLGKKLKSDCRDDKCHYIVCFSQKQEIQTVQYFPGMCHLFFCTFLRVKQRTVWNVGKYSIGNSINLNFRNHKHKNLIWISWFTHFKWFNYNFPSTLQEFRLSDDHTQCS